MRLSLALLDSGSWKWVLTAIALLALAGSCGVLQSACSPEPLAACLATAATRATDVDRIGEWGMHLGAGDSSFATGQPMGLAQKLVHSIGSAGRAVLAFCGISKQATEVERHECPGDLCMGGADHEGDEGLPLAAWYSAIKDRAAALLRCLPDEAEWLCACKAWVQRWAHCLVDRKVRVDVWLDSLKTHLLSLIPEWCRSEQIACSAANLCLTFFKQGGPSQTMVGCFDSVFCSGREALLEGCEKLRDACLHLLQDWLRAGEGRQCCWASMPCGCRKCAGSGPEPPVL